MKITEAIEKLKEGCKIRHLSWQEGFWYLVNGQIVTHDGSVLSNAVFMSYVINDVGEWEIYEEAYETGDWLTDGKVIIQYRYVKEKELLCEEDGSCILKLQSRRATKEEIEKEMKNRKWVDWGRKLDQWKVGDIVYDNSKRYYGSEKSVFVLTSDVYKNYDLSQLEMVCPVEKRVDIIQF